MIHLTHMNGGGLFFLFCLFQHGGGEGEHCERARVAVTNHDPGILVQLCGFIVSSSLAGENSSLA